MIQWPWFDDLFWQMCSRNYPVRRRFGLFLFLIVLFWFFCTMHPFVDAIFKTMGAWAYVTIIASDVSSVQ